jgi:hypothetical protein
MKMDSKFCAATGKSKEQKPVMMATASMGTAAAAGAKWKADGTVQLTIQSRTGATAES